MNEPTTRQEPRLARFFKVRGKTGLTTQYYEWLVLDKQTYLIAFDLGVPSSEKNKLASRIATLDHKAKRLLSPPSTKWDHVHKQLVNVIIFARTGAMAEANSLLKEAQETCRIHRQTQIKKLYLLGLILGSMISGCLGISIFEYGAQLNNIFAAKTVIGMFIFAALGSIVSALTRLNALTISESANNFDIILSGVIRPVVAALFSLVAYMLLVSKIFKLSIGDPSADPDLTFFVFGFFCGFSERFAHDLVSHLPLFRKSPSE